MVTWCNVAWYVTGGVRREEIVRSKCRLPVALGVGVWGVGWAPTPMCTFNPHGLETPLYLVVVGWVPTPMCTFNPQGLVLRAP